MRICFVLTAPIEEGGMALAVGRMATALAEAGHRCELAIPPQADPTLLQVPRRNVATLPPQARPVEDAARLSRELAEGAPDLLVVSDIRPEVLASAAAVAPTLLHSHAHWAVCPDGGRYWHRLGRECTVTAGSKCIALRPALECVGRDHVLSPRRVIDHRRRLELVRSGSVGTVAISSHQAELLRRHGVPDSGLAVIPNLGMRLEPGEIAEAADATPPAERSKVAFVGRLSREKGAGLLPALAEQLAPGQLLIYGDGYLRASLARHLGPAVRGHVSQARLAGLMAWSRVILLPSLWPEPGGIVGIDAQLFGAPLAAFSTGAALDWPRATLFPPGDSRAMGAWANRQPPVTMPRPAEAIASSQAGYWGRVQRRTDRLLRAYVADGRFPAPEPEAVRQDLQAVEDAG